MENETRLKKLLLSDKDVKITKTPDNLKLDLGKLKKSSAIYQTVDQRS